MKLRKFPQAGLSCALVAALLLQPALSVKARAEPGSHDIGDHKKPTRRELIDIRLNAAAKRTLGDYFPNTKVSSDASLTAAKPDPAELSRFQKEVSEIIARGGKKNAWDAAKFQAWWNANTTAGLTPGQIEAWKGLKLEALLGTAYLDFIKEQSDNNQTKFRSMVEDFVTNDFALDVLDGGVAAVVGVVSFLAGSIWGSLSFVITTDFVRAYTDTLTNTPKQVIAAMGAEHTGPLAAPMSAAGQTYVNYRQAKAAEKKAAKEAKAAAKLAAKGIPTGPQVAEAEEKVQRLNTELAEDAERHIQLVEVEKKVAALPDTLDRLLAPKFIPELTAAQHEKNLAGFNKGWAEAVVQWNQTTLPTAQTGRSLMTDAVIFRMKDFAKDGGIYEGKMELYRQGIEANKRAIAGAKEAERARLEQNTLERMHLAGVSDGSGEERRAAMQALIAEKETGLAKIADDEALIAKKADEYLKIVDELADLEFDNQPANWAKAKKLETELTELGLAPSLLSQIKEGQKALVVSRRQLVGTFATQMLHDMMYSELNRKMPDSIQQILQTMRHQFGFHHFEKALRGEIHKVLHQAGIDIGRDVAKSGQELAEKTVSLGQAAGALEKLQTAQTKAGISHLARIREAMRRMFLVRGTKYVINSCAAGFRAIGPKPKAPSL
ncbi:MAG: hypothetical protein EOP11_02420 [Proteobacteria bacterium]|nr:MAG: hypothetical protein EOP11_02420 [Pseudomonadota bacterium]